MPVWEIKRDLTDKEKAELNCRWWTPLRLTADPEQGYSHAIAKKYEYMTLCESASEGSYEVYHKLFAELSIYEAWEYITIRKANRFYA